MFSARRLDSDCASTSTGRDRLSQLSTNLQTSFGRFFAVARNVHKWAFNSSSLTTTRGHFTASAVTVSSSITSSASRPYSVIPID
jgi:hypothetical protein